MPDALLLVEDDDQLARALLRVLRGWGDVRRARTVAEGLVLVESGDYAALLSDWDLGEDSAHDVIVRSMRLHPSARRVVLSAHEPTQIRLWLPPGATDAILTKPCPAVLVRAAMQLRPSGSRD